jgi:hypothetical protein
MVFLGTIMLGAQNILSRAKAVADYQSKIAATRLA